MNTRAAPWFGLDRVEQRAVVELDAHHRLARALHRLGDRDRHFACLAVTEADAAVAVADHRQRGEAHLAAALDGLGHAVDRDQLLEEAVAVFTIVLGCRLRCSPCLPPLGECGLLLAAWPLGVVVIERSGFGIGSPERRSRPNRSS